MEGKRGFERVKKKESGGCIFPKSPITPPIKSQIKVLIGMNMGLVTQINLDMSVRDE